MQKKGENLWICNGGTVVVSEIDREFAIKNIFGDISVHLNIFCVPMEDYGR